MRAAARRSHDLDVSALEADLRAVKAEQTRLTRAVALADDVPALLTELRQRATRARSLEARISAIRQSPDERRRLIETAQAKVRANLGDLRGALLDRSDLRRVFLRTFPQGLRFHAARAGGRQV